MYWEETVQISFDKVWCS